MAFPKASVLWVNYNSMSFIDVVLESLQAISDLDYPNFEVIVVDNASTDGSYDVIRGFAERKGFRVIKLQRNTGFTGGNNAAFRARDKESRYVVLINNDAIPHQDFLSSIIERMENEEDVGGAQGIILSGDKIENMGCIVDEMLISHHLFRGRDPHVNRSFFVTYVNGALSAYKVKAILDVWHDERLFFDFGFGYFDDNVLGIQLWNKGWKCKAYPVITGTHKSGLSFKKRSSLRAYLSLRNSLLLNYMTNSRYKQLIPLYAFRDALPRASGAIDIIGRALIDFMRIKRLLKSYKLDLYRAPVVKLGLRELVELIGLRRRVTARISRGLLRSAEA